MKKRIRLTEGQLHKIVRRCINEAVNEISDKTVWNATHKAANAMNSRGQFPSFRKEVQYHNLSDASWDRAHKPNSISMRNLVKAIEEEFPYIYDYDHYDYWECRDLMHEISDTFKVPQDVATAALQMILPEDPNEV